jgi:hypothetical protein
MGSLGRLGGASLGTAVFLKNHAYKKCTQTTEGVSLCGAATFIVSGGMEEFCPRLCNPLNTYVTH